eukprot:6213717-Pleurochrysis_carterae.AAC.2
MQGEEKVVTKMHRRGWPSEAPSGAPAGWAVGLGRFAVGRLKKAARAARLCRSLLSLALAFIGLCQFFSLSFSLGISLYSGMLFCYLLQLLLKTVEARLPISRCMVMAGQDHH